ncbi:MAG: HEAT repeat domain-containing protein [Planctomycetaceae bacterium]|jgi:hypothetical protein|nr:HEAT repeat domain-containing protein [Planctomycetaceae bacterium]
MRPTSITATIFLFVFIGFVCVDLYAQTAPPPERLQWNHAARPSFVKGDKKVVYPDFLPRLPTKEECTKYALKTDDAYRDDSLTMLSLFVDTKHIPSDMKANLIAFRCSPKDQPIMFLPNLIKKSNVPVRDGLFACWSTNEWSFFYIDTATSVVLLVQQNPDYSWSSDNEYASIAQVLRPDFADMIQDHSLVEEELIARRPLVVASLRQRNISTDEQAKRRPYGLAAEATFFRDEANHITVLRCDKLLDKSKITASISRFSPEVKQDKLLAAVQKQAPQPSVSVPPPPAPAMGTDAEIMAMMKKHDKEMKEAETRRTELIRTETGRLKLITSFADSKINKSDKDATLFLLWEFYEKNIRNEIDMPPLELNALEKLLQNKDAFCRNCALRLMYSTKPGVVQKIYFERYSNEKDIENRKYMIESLGWKGDKKAIPFLESILTNKENPVVVRHAAWKTSNYIEMRFESL